MSLQSIDGGYLIHCERDNNSYYVSPDGNVRFNPHAHCTVSDGEKSVEEIGDLTNRSMVNIGLMDHQICARGPLPNGVFRSVEILTLQGADIGVHGPGDAIEDLVDSVVVPNLNPDNPLYTPSKVCVHRLLREIIRRDLVGILAHYFARDGVSRLPPDEQAEILSVGRSHLFLEHNVLMTRRQNLLAKALSEATGIPLLYTGDTHRGAWQYVGTWTAVPAKLIDDDPKTAFVQRVLNAVRRHQEHVTAQTYEPGFLEKALTALHIASRIGIGPVATCVKETIGRILGFLPVHSIDTILSPPIPRKLRKRRRPAFA